MTKLELLLKENTKLTVIRTNEDIVVTCENELGKIEEFRVNSLHVAIEEVELENSISLPPACSGWKPIFTC